MLMQIPTKTKKPVKRKITEKNKKHCTKEKNRTQIKSKKSPKNSRKTRKLANLTQLNILVVSHNEDNVGPDVSAVSLDATPQALSPRGDEGPAAWSPVQRQQGQPSQPLHQHGA